MTKTSWEKELKSLLITALADFATEKEIRKPIKRKSGALVLPDLGDITEKHYKKLEALFDQELKRERLKMGKQVKKFAKNNSITFGPDDNLRFPVDFVMTNHLIEATNNYLKEKEVKKVKHEV